MITLAWYLIPIFFIILCLRAEHKIYKVMKTGRSPYKEENAMLTYLVLVLISFLIVTTYIVMTNA